MNMNNWHVICSLVPFGPRDCHFGQTGCEEVMTRSHRAPCSTRSPEAQYLNNHNVQCEHGNLTQVAVQQPVTSVTTLNSRRKRQPHENSIPPGQGLFSQLRAEAAGGLPAPDQRVTDSAVSGPGSCAEANMPAETWNESGRVWEEDHGLLDDEQVAKCAAGRRGGAAPLARADADDQQRRVHARAADRQAEAGRVAAGRAGRRGEPASWASAGGSSWPARAAWRPRCWP